jgi:hypothetical protein
MIIMCSKAAHEIVLSSRCRVLRTLRSGQDEMAAWPCGSFTLPSGAIRLLKDVFKQEEPRLTSFSEQRFCALPTWWFWRGGCTRSHSEPGRETPQRRWYFVLRRGRVGRRQVCKSQKLLLNHDPSAKPPKPKAANRGLFCFNRTSNTAAKSKTIKRARAAHAGPQKAEAFEDRQKKTGHARTLTITRGGAAR